MMDDEIKVLADVVDILSKLHKEGRSRTLKYLIERFKDDISGVTELPMLKTVEAYIPYTPSSNSLSPTSMLGKTLATIRAAGASIHVGAIAQAIGASRPVTAARLSELKKMGLVVRERCGYYKASPKRER